MADIQFVEGVRVYLPRAGAPSNLVANIVFEDGKRWNLWKSKAGTSLYLAVDTWKPSQDRQQSARESGYTAPPRHAPPPPYPAAAQRQSAPRPPTPPAPQQPNLPTEQEDECIDDIPFDETPEQEYARIMARLAPKSSDGPTADQVYPNRARGSNYCGD
jgi:hypothetical protein